MREHPCRLNSLYCNILTHQLFCTGISSLTSYFALECSYWLNICCTRISLPTEYFAVEYRYWPFFIALQNTSDFLYFALQYLHWLRFCTDSIFALQHIRCGYRWCNTCKPILTSPKPPMETTQQTVVPTVFEVSFGISHYNFTAVLVFLTDIFPIFF